MLIESVNKLEVGDIIDGKDHHNGFNFDGTVYYNYRFKVIRVSSKEEYLKDTGCPFAIYRYFYEISMD